MNSTVATPQNINYDGFYTLITPNSPISHFRWLFHQISNSAHLNGDFYMVDCDTPIQVTI